MTNHFNGRLDRIERQANPRRSLTYTVGIDFPGEETAAWLQSQKEAGVIGPHDLVVGICRLSDPHLPPQFLPPHRGQKVQRHRQANRLGRPPWQFRREQVLAFEPVASC